MKIIFSTFMLMALFLGGCSNSNDPAPAPPTPTIMSLEITPKVVVLDVETTQIYTAWTILSDGNKEDVSDQVTWSLKNNTGAIVFDQPNPAEARAAAIGTDDIVATLSTFTAEVVATVVNDTLMSISISPNDVELLLPYTSQFIATGTYLNGHTQDLTQESTWASNDTAVITIDANGLASPVAVGNTSITAGFDGQVGIATVGVTAPDQVDHIIIEPEGYDFIAGTQKQFRAYAHYTDTTRPDQEITKNCTWLSDDLNLVSEVLGTRKKEGFFQASDVQTGRTNITAEFSVRLDAVISVTVDEDYKTIINRTEIIPEVYTILNGESKKFIVDAVTQDANRITISNQPGHTFSVDDDTFLVIGNTPADNGVAYALQVGTAIITSTFEYEGEIFVTHARVTIQ